MYIKIFIAAIILAAIVGGGMALLPLNSKDSRVVVQDIHPPSPSPSQSLDVQITENLVVGSPHTESKNTDWKIYGNSKYGFKFEYPQGYLLTVEEKSIGTDFIGTISASLTLNGQDVIRLAAVDDIIFPLFQNTLDRKNIDKGVVVGENTFNFTYKDPIAGNVFIAKKYGMIYAVVYGELLTKEIRDKIISTLILIKPTGKKYIKNEFDEHFMETAGPFFGSLTFENTPQWTEYILQIKDDTRFRELEEIMSAITLYTIDVKDPVLCEEKTVYITANLNTNISTSPGWNVKRSDNNNIDGTGWIPLDFNKISGGYTFSHGKIPLDPENSEKYFFAYACDRVAGTFELNARPETEKGNTKAKTDGGFNPLIYEIGSNLNIIPDSIWQ